ncbi:hypothetical protein AAVH_19138 [Aphelenchoides avenae]|nr:hypothetical protein AAVH_19138 [Aphelenchus avenae]
MTTSPKVVSSKKPPEPKSTTSKPRDCPCRKEKTTIHTPKQPEATTVPTKKPHDPKGSTEKPHDCGEPPKKPLGSNEPKEPPKKPEDP